MSNENDRKVTVTIELPWFYHEALVAINEDARRKYPDLRQQSWEAGIVDCVGVVIGQVHRGAEKAVENGEVERQALVDKLNDIHKRAYGDAPTDGDDLLAALRAAGFDPHVIDASSLGKVS